jgi:hypothetical protein
MNRRSASCSRLRWTLLALAAAAASTVALGADKPAAAQSRAVFERELAVCRGKPSNEDRATCLREANAAYAEARRGNLTAADPAQLAANALRRCDALPEADRKDCVARMTGQGTTRGSVAEGGIYRELVTREPGIAASAPAAAAK